MRIFFIELAFRYPRNSYNFTIFQKKELTTLFVIIILCLTRKVVKSTKNIVKFH